MADLLLRRSKRVIRSEVEGRRDVARERRHQKRYALLHGYFWRPCGLCGEHFGGHEAWGTLPADDEEDRYDGICPMCTKERQEAAERTLRQLRQATTFSVARWGGDGWVSHRVGYRPEGSHG